MINLNDVLSRLNKESNQHKQLGNFMKNQSTKNFIIKHNCLIKTKRGKYGGTYVDEKLFNFFLDWYNNNNTPSYVRDENVLFHIIKNCVESVNRDYYVIEKQLNVLTYMVDISLSFKDENIDNYNCGEYMKGIYLIEFDEYHHLYIKDIDKIREDNIFNELSKIYNYIKLIRVPQSMLFHFISYCIPYFTHVDTNYTMSCIKNLFYVKEYHNKQE